MTTILFFSQIYRSRTWTGHNIDDFSFFHNVWNLDGWGDPECPGMMQRARKRNHLKAFVCLAPGWDTSKAGLCWDF